MAIASRSTGVKKAGGDKRVRFLAQQFGPFTVSFAPAYKQVKKDGKTSFVPTGELAMKIDIGDTFPLVSLGWNAEGKGALATVAEHLDQFGEAVMAAVEAWQSDEQFNSAMAELKDAMTQQAAAPAANAKPKNGGPLTSRVSAAQQAASLQSA